jgi:hypothetical protein
MGFPRYDPDNKVLQEIFFSELRRQVEIIDKIENKKEKKIKMYKLRVEVYRAILESKKIKKEKTKKNIFKKIYSYIRHIIINIINIIKGI